MKINFVIPNPGQVSGVTTWSTEMANCLSQTHEVNCFLHHDGEKELPLLSNEVQTYKIPTPQPYRIYESQLPKYYAPIYKNAIGGIIIPNSLDGTYGAVLSILKNEPDAIRIIGMAHSDAPDYYEWLSWFEPVIHKFIAVSDEIKTNLEALLPANRAQDILVKSCPVKLLPTRIEKEPLSDLKITYSGRIEEKQKQVMQLPKLATHLKKRGVHCHWTICGDGSKLPALRDAFKRENIAADFTGKLTHDEMLKQWQGTDVCVLVSSYEGSSVALLEAMGHACAPVVYDVSGMKKIIPSDQAGRLCPLNNLEAMAAAIQELSEDPTLLSRIKRNAQAHIEQEYSYESYLPWFIKLSEDIMNEEPRLWPRSHIFKRKWLARKLAARFIGKGTFLGRYLSR